MRTLVALAMSAMMAVPSMAGTSDGYQSGGGAGIDKCPVFVDAMRLSREHGGNAAPAGRAAVSIYAQYLAGYVTAWNGVMPGIFDVLAGLQPDAIENGLVVIETFCTANPTANFDDGIIDLMRQMAPTADRRE